MSNKRQRHNRAERREAWRDTLSGMGLKEMTLGVWRCDKIGVDFYPSKLKAYNYITHKMLDWEEAMLLIDKYYK